MFFARKGVARLTLMRRHSYRFFSGVTAGYSVFPTSLRSPTHHLVFRWPTCGPDQANAARRVADHNSEASAA